MTVEYTVETEGSWLSVAYRMGPTGPLSTFRVHKLSITGLHTTELFDQFARLVPGTSVFFNGLQQDVPVPLAELSEAIGPY